MEYTQITLDEWQQMKQKLKQELLGVKHSFVRIGFALRKIEEQRLYEQDGYKSIAEFAKEVTVEKEARENAIKTVKEGVNDSLLIQEVAIELEAIAAGKTYKPTVNLPYIEGYTPICAFFKASGSNNIYNYYSRIDLINDDKTHNRYYQLYTEWKNPSSVNVSKATAGFNVLYRKMIS